MLSENAVKDVTHLHMSNMFTLHLKTSELYFLGNTDDGNKFHSLAVRIMKVEAKRGYENMKHFNQERVRVKGGLSEGH